MKKRISFLLVAVLLLATLIPALPVLAADGEAVANTFNANDANPTISTAADYIAFFKAITTDGNEFGGKTVTMVKDIALNDTTAADWYTKADVVKLAGAPNGYFTGIFDGGNHTLRGVVTTETGNVWDAPTGLFPRAGFGGVIKNLTVDGFYVCSSNTTVDPTWGKAGIGGLIGHAKKLISVENVTMRNGIVTCVENGKGGIGALIGAYDGAEGEMLPLMNCVVEKTVQVIAGKNSNAYVAGIVGVVYASENTPFRKNLNVTGSMFTASGAVGKELKAFGYCYNGNGGNAHMWNVQNDATGYSQMSGEFKSTEYTDQLNALLDASGCYGLSAAPVVRAAGTQTRSSDNGVRFVGLVKIPESLEAITVLGFEVTVGDKTVGAEKISCTKVYTSIEADGKNLEAPEGYYYFTFVVKDVTAETTFAWSACATVDGKECKTTVSSFTYTPAAN